MKTKKMLVTAGLAVAAFAAQFAAFAAPGDGDTVDIRVVDTDAMGFGTRNSLAPEDYRCSASNPLVAGDDLYVRVRMLVSNWQEVMGSHGAYEPKTWYFAPGLIGGSSLDLSLYKPRLGLWIGEHLAEAEYTSTGPKAWQKSGMLETDDAGNPNTDWKYYTDFYFVYKVKPGDLGLPVKLSNSTGTGPASTGDSNTGYYLRYCSSDGLDHWVLRNSDGDVAKFRMYADDAGSIPTDWPTSSYTDDGPQIPGDLSVEGAFVKTIDFDKVNAAGDPYSEGDVWRDIYPGMSAAPGTTPTLLIGGGPIAEAMSVYIWSSDETVMVPVASGANTISTVDGKKVLKVQVPVGAESVTFAMKGADGAAVGATATVYLSPEQTAVYKPTGELLDVTVSRTVQVITAPEPTVSIVLGGDLATDSVTADADYVTAKKQLVIKMVPACDYPVTVRLDASVSGDDTLTSLNAIYDANIIRIADQDYGGDPLDQKTFEVEIPANRSVVYKNIYVLGGTSRTGTKGITFSTEKISGPDNVTTKGSCTLKVNRSTPTIVASDPAFSTEESPSTISVESGKSQTFTLEIADSYRDLNEPATGYADLGSLVGYTFKWACDGEDVDDDTNITMDDDGLFVGSAKFWNITAGKELTLCVVSPDGRVSAKVKYNLVVSDAKKTTIALTDTTKLVFAENEGSTWVNLGLSQPYKGKGYIFIGADDPADLLCVTSAAMTAGAQISQGQSEADAPRQIHFLDGDRDVTLKAFLCTANDPTTKVPSYVEGTLSFTITNVPPQFKSCTAAGQYLTSEKYGQRIDPVSRGVAKTFSVDVKDVAADLNATGDKAMSIKWEIDGQTYYTSGNPSTQSVQHTFANSKQAAQVIISAKDKDMLDYETIFMFYVPVSEKPGVSISTSAEGGIFNENDAKKNSAKITVKLSESANAEITVRFTVSQAADGGYLKLSTFPGSVDEVSTGVYDLTFPSTVTTKVLDVIDMDGTDDTMAGLYLSAEVTTETVNDDGVKWCDFYTKAEPTSVRVQNIAPEILRPTEAEEAYTNMNASANTPYDIRYACTDVTADLAAGVTVEISIDGAPVHSEKLYDSTSHMYSAEFEGEGAHTVEFTFTDKDGDSSRRSVNYYVSPSKNLQLRAHGPAGSVGTSGGYSQHYGLAAGLGAGRVFAGATGPQKVQGFDHSYSFRINAASALAYGYGYKADGNDDDGSLGPDPSRDRGIDKNGNWSSGSAISEYYNYTTQHKWGKLGFDSFLYVWACNNTENTSTTGGDSMTTASLIFNIGESGTVIIPLPEYDQQGQSQGGQTASSAIPVQYWEGVFSREFLKADNCGDINLDGIPDAAVYRYGMGIFDLTTHSLIESGGGGATEGDLTDLRGFNGDLDKDGAESPDFLPSSDLAVYGSLIPGLAGTWSSDFGARLEIRGYHDGLNDALAQLGFDIESDRVYAEEVDGEWQWTTNCTISKTEWYAWTEYAAAHGLDWKNPDAWAEWSPERPTSPIYCDTDRDGFDDGYEYYFWYKAHVGWLETDAKGNNVVHKRLTGRRYDAKNPGDGVLIASEVIERLMDPLVATDQESAKTRDTDNDGLPDLLEFEIGTNPFDFDTDGDGLPDGWELMIAGLNPLLERSAADAVLDQARNYDGDAMAMTSYKLEAAWETPANLHPEHVRYTTFAVIADDGDTDGVQWYATKAAVAFETNTVTCWTFTLADGTECAATEAPVLTDDGRLAKPLDRSGTYTSVTETTVEIDDSDPENPITNVTTFVMRGWPIRLEAGTPVVADSVSADVEVSVLAVTEEIAATDAYAAWVYGKGTNDTARGEVAATAADYGCLALGRRLAVPAGAEICAVPSDERDVALLHYLVYQQFGFDPRTAWRSKSPLADRWGSTANGEGVEGVYIVRRGGYCTYPARTREYAAYDEFLVYSFFLNNGCDMSGYTYVMADKAPYLAKVWGALTTNPQGPNEPGNITLNQGVNGDSDAAAEYYFGRNSDNGADTDGDGVPDGWELYVMSGPRDKGAFVFAPPYAGFATGLNPNAMMAESYLSPFVGSAKSNYTNNQIYLGGSENDDKLNEYQEFESTDAMNHYAGVYSNVTTTVAHTGDWKWFNKFFPSDPWSVDTDGDGLSDSDEGKHFIYGTPADDGKLRSIPGGGLNPCSVDTDCDGLPDEWEKQFKGKTPFPGSLAPLLAERGNKAKDASGNEIGNYLQGLVDGMDGTVKDAFSYPIEADFKGETSTNVTMFTIADGVTQVVNRDYDHDGLENWQEYLTGTMRCWRYDDPLSPWTAIPTEFYWTYNETDDKWEWDPKYADVGMTSDEFWYATLVDKASPYYNPRLVTDSTSGSQYFSRLTNVWDAAYLDSGLGEAGGAYYWFRKRIGDALIKDIWTPLMISTDLLLQGGWMQEPQKYASCSPLDADSDRDGMDDYYELFHGMNPLLGKSGVRAGGSQTDDEGPFDIVHDSWTTSSARNALEAWGTGDQMNYWQKNPWKTPRGNGYDFEVFPWLNGVADADPDGDSIPNQTESMLPEMNVGALHTDPTPLWMTDTTYTNSLVRRFFRLPARFGEVELDGDTFTYGEGEDETVYSFKDFDTWVPPIPLLKPARFAAFKPDAWELLAKDKPGWMFSFEENEGFDSDHDGIGDYEEKEGKFNGASDPQYADSPRRRQAMYFQGPERPSALQTMPEIPEFYPTLSGYPDDPSFLQYTVECWVRPTSLADAVIVERAVWSSVENPADDEYMRKNFQIAIKDGKWYTKFDPVGTASGGPIEAVSKTLAAEEWTHLAATYDGETLVFYVNGVAERRVSSGLPPCYGSEALAVTAFQKYWFDIEYNLTAVIVGASAKTQAEGAPDGGALDLTRGLGWDRYSKFFTGWVDEVRIWDGARTGAEIKDAMRTRMTAELAADNRSAFYETWADGKRRYDKVSANDYVPAELRYHWSFDSIFGADNENAAATAPHNFGGARALMSRPEGYEIQWWKTVLEGDGTNPGYSGTVYADTDWICWIPNTVTHLPRFDGTTLDSVYWSANYKGYTDGTYGFARNAEPVSRWTQLTRANVADRLQYRTTGSRHWFVNVNSGSSGNKHFINLFSFTGRHLNQSGDDLVALGGAFAKYCDDGVDMWDEQGPSTNWEITGSDADGDGLPDWWEQYADENYRPAGMDPSEEITWATILDWNGLMITAGEAYLRDLARGAYMNGSGEIVAGITKYEQVADEDHNGIPDWWANFYGISGESGLDDHDHDGLPNYVEYLLSEVFAFDEHVFDPTDPCSVDQYTPDYFYRVGSLYVGEIFTDHDLVDDVWEDAHGTLVNGVTPYASRLSYDAAADVDEDGWSNRSENRSAYWFGYRFADIIDTWLNSGLDSNFRSYPMPTLAIRPIYNGGFWRVNGKTFIVRARRTGSAYHDVQFTAVGNESENEGGNKPEVSRVVGITHNGPRVIHGHLHPGHILPDDGVTFEMGAINGEVLYTWHCTYCGRAASTTSYEEYSVHKQDHGKAETNDVQITKGVVLDGRVPPPAQTVAKSRCDSDSRTGKIVSEGCSGLKIPEGIEIGSINFLTGEYEMDLGKLAERGADVYGKYVRAQCFYRIGKEWPQTFYFSDPEQYPGRLKEGPNTIEAFFDVDGNGEYDPGVDPYGVVQNVDISWAGTPTVEIELTDESPITPRFDIWATGAALYSTTNVTASGENDAISASEPMRVRVVRWKVDGFPSYRYPFEPRVVFDRMMDPRKTTTLTEAYFLDENTHDIDWEYFSSEIANSGVAAYYPVTEAEYLVVLGDGPVSWLNADDTNTFVFASTKVIKRKFDENRVLPTPVAAVSVSPVSSAAGIVSSANPTFTWKIDSDTYTAFRIIVTNGTETVYDSGIRRAPVRDENGVYRWTAPLYADDMTPSGKVFANKSTYGWRVSMYNAKFRSNAYSTEPATFYLNVQTNGYLYGTANVAVRYFGPKESFDARAVRVQAFTSPDFTGIPVAAGYVKGKSATLDAVGAKPQANCSIIGLPLSAPGATTTGEAHGTYYLRAFIDSDKDGVCDDWESSGYLCVRDGSALNNILAGDGSVSTENILNPTPIKIGPDVGYGDLAVIYIEDADTDEDGLPDSWEYAKYGDLSKKGIELISETPAAEMLVNKRLTGALELRANARIPTAGLSSTLRSSLSNAGTLALAMGASPQDDESFTAAISGAVSPKLAEDGVSITSLEFVDGKVSITVSAETKPAEHSAAASALVDSEALKGDIPAVATVYWTQSLVNPQWTPVKSQNIVVGSGEDTIDIGNAVPEGVSGFFRVEVMEK
ncbi:MAG: LamG domain-containing protein [Kiritimatiellae bacterium]|nr:LamG domain-containing protein [Kiritimatiellia bacterium]